MLGSWPTLGNEVWTQVALIRGTPSGTEPFVATARSAKVKKPGQSEGWVANPEKAFTDDLPELEGLMLGGHRTSKTKSEPWNIKEEENVKTAVAKLPLLERIAVPKCPPRGS